MSCYLSVKTLTFKGESKNGQFEAHILSIVPSIGDNADPLGGDWWREGDGLGLRGVYVGRNELQKGDNTRINTTG